MTGIVSKKIQCILVLCISKGKTLRCMYLKTKVRNLKRNALLFGTVIKLRIVKIKSINKINCLRDEVIHKTDTYVIHCARN